MGGGMTNEDITRMAREAGWKDLPFDLAFAGFDLSYFASLVYEATFRDACIAASKTILDAAVLEEREACAVAGGAAADAGLDVAAAIRARSKE